MLETIPDHLLSTFCVEARSVCVVFASHVATFLLAAHSLESLLQPLNLQRFPNIVQVGRTRRPFNGLLWPKQASLVWQHAMCILRLVVAAATLEERWSLQLRATILALEADLPALE